MWSEDEVDDDCVALLTAFNGLMQGRFLGLEEGVSIYGSAKNFWDTDRSFFDTSQFLDSLLSRDVLQTWARYLYYIPSPTPFKLHFLDGGLFCTTCVRSVGREFLKPASSFGLLFQ